MITDLTSVKNYFAKLGLEPEVAELYLALHAYGPQTISELARNSGVERTRIYRLIDAIQETNLIEIETHYKRSIFKAASISNLQILLSKKEEELRNLQEELESINRSLTPNSISSPTTRVHFYRGMDGLKQMFWNQTKSEGENLSILFENMQGRTKSAFFERWVRKCNERQMKFRGIIGDNFIASQQNWYADRQNERLEHWDSRYIPASIFQITHSMIIHGEVVAYYNWRDGEIFGIELYNQEIADAQRKFFEMLWALSSPVDDLVGPKKLMPN